jgi:ATP-GRASP peptide maturase of grasp-with-spasm system
MIVLVSKSEDEQSTDEIIDWLLFKNKNYERINGSDFLENCFSITVTNNSKNFSVYKNKDVESLFNIDCKNFLWFRRWYDDISNIKQKKLFNSGIKRKDKIGISIALEAHIKNERKVVSDWILYHLHKNNCSLNSCGFIKLNKLEVLEQASGLGLNIPETIVTNSKHDLIAFFNTHGRIITKALSESMVYLDDTDSTIMYTEEVTAELVSKLPQQFGVYLFQSLLEKEFELRVFYLDKKFYSMAIFSQSNTKTAIDFRRYDHSKANRCVPFILPRKLEKKLVKLLEQLDLQSASIDMVYTCDDKYVFLEINPIGQFGMVSIPCNYYLEEKVADFLISRAKDIYEK